MAKPVEVAALFPLGEVLFVDGASAEAGGHDFLGLGEAIEPHNEGDAGLAIAEAVAKLIVDDEG